ncbi:MAG TPA: galactokinase family protein [Solirubrobacteraceae bacterium]|nr:galactokinase family protein [Solirubrobacteraceae bacterium]
MPRERAAAFAPGRVNVIGEHTDYNQGLALPFAIAEGVGVRAEADRERPETVRVQARDLGEHDEFPLREPGPARGWRAFVRGMVAELDGAGYPLVGARVRIEGELARGSGLSSSAALEVALCLALVALGGGAVPGAAETRDRLELARLCARVENEWVGARTGLLDQLASLCGEREHALCIDFRALSVTPIALQLGEWRFAVLDSGERHAHASSGYNERRAECARACELLGVGSLREADAGAVAGLPEPLGRRARHVLGENRRVREAVAAIAAGELGALGALLNRSHASLRDDYEVSTPAVERAVARLRQAGAAGARVVGGGFGGIVLGLFAPATPLPAGAHEVRPSAGARLL